MARVARSGFFSMPQVCRLPHLDVQALDVAEARQLDHGSGEEIAQRDQLLADHVELRRAVPVDDGDAHQLRAVRGGGKDEREAPGRLELTRGEGGAESLAADLQ